MEPRNESITVRLTKLEREQVQRCAAEAGESLSKFIHNLIAQAIEETK